MDRGEWEDDADYPRAPLPAHERTWRHPSELGATQWTRTEPPLVVGRGLSIATGTIGAALALGLLWLMIPHGTGGGVAIEESTTSLRSTPLSASGRLIDPSASSPVSTPASTPSMSTALVSTSLAAPSTDVTESSVDENDDVEVGAPTTPPTVANSTAPPATPVPTALVENAAVNERVPAIAVALSTGHYVVTTAVAVNGRTTMAVQLPNGEKVQGSVVSVDAASGIAVLSVPATIEATTYALSDAVVPADGLSISTSGGATVRIWTDATGTHIAYEPGNSPREGTLVVDREGRLMGMCTKDNNGLHLVGIGSMLVALDAASAGDAPSLGVRAAIGPDGAVTIAETTAGGPAELAGLHTGDVVRAIDGVAVTDLGALAAALSTRAPGDVITLSVVTPGNATPTDVTVTLAGSLGLPAPGAAQRG